jgi:AcrR family transcriptional regulator
MTRKKIRDIRHEEFIVAALEATHKRGFHAVTMSEIAAELGATAASINYYFGSKDQLMFETMRHLLRILIPDFSPPNIAVFGCNSGPRLPTQHIWNGYIGSTNQGLNHISARNLHLWSLPHSAKQCDEFCSLIWMVFG